MKIYWKNAMEETRGGGGWKVLSNKSCDKVTLNQKVFPPTQSYWSPQVHCKPIRNNPPASPALIGCRPTQWIPNPSIKGLTSTIKTHNSNAHTTANNERDQSSSLYALNETYAHTVRVYNTRGKYTSCTWQQQECTAPSKLQWSAEYKAFNLYLIKWIIITIR